MIVAQRLPRPRDRSEGRGTGIAAPRSRHERAAPGRRRDLRAQPPPSRSAESSSSASSQRRQVSRSPGVGLLAGGAQRTMAVT